MPALRLCGHAYLIGSDDFVFLVPMTCLLNALQIVADTEITTRTGAHNLGVPSVFLALNCLVCIAAIGADVVLLVLSAAGAVMETHKRETTCFFGILWLRAVLFAANFASLLVPVGCVIRFWVTKFGRGGGAPWIDDEAVAREVVGGWGSFSQNHCMQASLYFVHLKVACLSDILCFFLVSVSWSSRPVSQRLSYCLLWFASARPAIVRNVASVLMQVVQRKKDPVDLVPSDLIFGLLLLQSKQKQGAWYVQSDDELSSIPTAELSSMDSWSSVFSGSSSREEASDGEVERLISPEGTDDVESLMTPWVKHACELTMGTKPVAFEVASESDQDALREINQLTPYINGIYGAAMSWYAKSVVPGTTIPDPRRCARASMKAWPPGACCCCFCTGTRSWNDHALRYTLEAAAAQEGAATPEVLWSRWEHKGAGRVGPFAVVLDREHKQLVITFRGSMDIKDLLVNFCSMPEFFDPLGLATPESRKEPPFDNATDFFVHGAIYQCALDAERQLERSGVLKEALQKGGPAEGFRVVCVGHSLGAGIACIFALLLKMKKICPDVRFVGVEPPGGLLSRRLAEETEKLGWLSAVCSYDWVPRISIKALQNLREEILHELEVCGRSKLQIALVMVSRLLLHTPCLCCLRRPLGRLFERLGGGPLEHSCESPRGRGGVSTRKRSATEDEEGFWFEELWPPGRLAYFRPTSQELLCCGQCVRDTNVAVEWVRPEDLQENLIISARTVELHFPWILDYTFRLGAQKYSTKPHTPMADPCASSARGCYLAPRQCNGEPQRV